MREILFRGKRTDNGEWVYGAFYKEPYSERDLIIAWNSFGLGFNEEIQVYRETVGQYTGLTDKNGKKIFEGDMFRMDDDEDDVGVIIFKDGCFRLEIHGLCGTWTESGFDECGGGYGIIECEPIDYWYIKDIEVIGNIHDNPELLNGEER